MAKQVQKTTGTIIGFDVNIIENNNLTASLHLRIADLDFIFGGSRLFMTEATEINSNFVTLFLFRILETCKVTSLNLLPGSEIRVHLIQNQIVGIACLESEDWFYPVKEFEILAKGE